MLSLNTHLNLKTIKKSKKLQGVKSSFFGTQLDRTQKPWKQYTSLCIADIIDSDLLTDNDKRKLLDQCIADWNIDSISKNILENIK